MRTQCREDGSERVRRVGIIDDDPPAVLSFGNELQSTGDAGQMSKRLDGRCRRAPGCCNKTQRSQRIHRLEGAREWQYQPTSMTKNIEEQSLALAFRLARDKAEISDGVGAIRENRMARFAAYCG